MNAVVVEFIEYLTQTKNYSSHTATAYETDIRDFVGWDIEGDEAEYWVSSQINYKAKIVEKDGEIYFEGYKWKSITGKECGFTHIYQVAYNEEERSIRLQLVG